MWRASRRVHEAEYLRKEINTEIKRILTSAFFKISSDAPRLPMADVAPLVRSPIKVDFEKDYLELGVRLFGNGTFHKPALKLRELQSASGEELSALMPSILDKAFKGEL